MQIFKNRKLFLAAMLFFFSIMTFHVKAEEYFDLSIEGSTGWNAISYTLKADAAVSSADIANISAGTAFRIEEEDGDWWKIVLADGTEGYIQYDYCMINLPDILPTIEYDITNSYSSIFQSSGYSIEGVTGEKLYSAGDEEGKVWNEKLEKYEYLAPVMYSTAKKIAIAQYNAYTLTDGQYTLKIYDSYRPHSVTMYISEKFADLYYSNSDVQKNVDINTQSDGNSYSWGTGWFLAKSLSTHNTGAAIDVTLCEYDPLYEEYVELPMQTVMHELSTDAIKYYSGSVDKIPENYADEMNDNAILLDYIFRGEEYEGYNFVSTGMTTLASEWWHFQDNETYGRVKEFASSGMDFQVEKCLSE